MKNKKLLLLLTFILSFLLRSYSQSINITSKPDFHEEDFVSKPKSVEMKRYGAYEKFGETIEVLIDSTKLIYDNYGRLIKKINSVCESLPDILKPKWEGNYTRFQDPDYYNYNVCYTMKYNSNGIESYDWTKLGGGRFDENCTKNAITHEGNNVTLKELSCGRNTNNSISNFFLDENSNVVRKEAGNLIEIAKYNKNDSLVEYKVYSNDGILK
jgi:hypothetical protein